jgi:outer membrane protein
MKQKAGIGILILLVLGAITFSTIQYLSSPKVAYVDLTKAYNEFSMKKDLEKKLQSTVSARQNILDSLKFRLQQLSLNIQSSAKGPEMQNKMNEFALLKQEYQQKQAGFEESSSVLMQQYEKDIWTQLNKYAELFSDEKGYDIILGANGSGNVMFGRKKFEVTDDFISFVNIRHNGK